MHKEILSKEQIQLLSLLKKFKREYYLDGGTAIALQIGHRRSIDFDMFKNAALKPTSILNKIKAFSKNYNVIRNTSDQFDIIVDGVKLTFLQYPFKVTANLQFENNLRMPHLIDLAAMKAYALGRRSKWKDYVDLYFLLKNHFSIKEVSDKANQIFGDLFSEKLFRSQLAYHKDIDYTEQVEFIEKNMPPETIRAYLISKSLDILD